MTPKMIEMAPVMIAVRWPFATAGSSRLVTDGGGVLLLLGGAASGASRCCSPSPSALQMCVGWLR